MCDTRRRALARQPQAVPPVPDETRRLARAACPTGHVDSRLRAARGAIDQAQRCAPLLPARGPPAAAPWRVALTTIRPGAAGRAERHAADAVRRRSDWQDAWSVERTDPGVDVSVRRALRARRMAGAREPQRLAARLTQFTARGGRRARGPHRPDATHGRAAMRTLHRVERVGDTWRATLPSLAVVAPAWRLTLVTAEWFAHSGTPVEASRRPQGQAAREG
jgi:hypothetical protein